MEKVKPGSSSADAGVRPVAVVLSIVFEGSLPSNQWLLWRAGLSGCHRCWLDQLYSNTGCALVLRAGVQFTIELCCAVGEQPKLVEEKVYACTFEDCGC